MSEDRTREEKLIDRINAGQMVPGEVDTAEKKSHGRYQMGKQKTRLKFGRTIFSFRVSRFSQNQHIDKHSEGGQKGTLKVLVKAGQTYPREKACIRAFLMSLALGIGIGLVLQNIFERK
jgi:hypothetical protein